jgi:hypothetical protein
MAADARHDPRLPCSFPASADGPRGKVRGTCTNLSQGGLFLEGVQLALGSSTVVHVDLGGFGALSIPAQVRHHQLTPRGMGVQFLRLEQPQAEKLKAVLARLAA